MDVYARYTTCWRSEVYVEYIPQPYELPHKPPPHQVVYTPPKHDLYILYDNYYIIIMFVSHTCVSVKEVRSFCGLG